MNIIRNKEYYEELDSKNATPPPGTYTIKDDIVKPKVQVPIFGQPNSSPMSQKKGSGANVPRPSNISNQRQIDTNQIPLNDNPPPGSYNIEDGEKATKYQSPGAVIAPLSSSKSKKPNKHQNPGPGQHQIKDDLIKPKVKSGQISPFKSKGKNNFNQYKDKNSLMYQASLQDLQKLIEPEQVPGPGQYNVDDEAIIPRVIVPIIKKDGAKRFEDRPRSKSPGPGSYEKPSSFLQKGAVICPKPQFKNRIIKEDITPAPGQYSASDKILQAKILHAKFHPPSQTQSRKTKQDYSPAPGQYNPSDHAIRTRSPFVKMKNRQNDRNLYFPRKDQNPGPGTYDLKSSFNPDTAAPFLQEARPNIVKSNNLPGPGQYDAPERSLSRPKSAVIFDHMHVSKSVRRLNKSVMEPGPGSYDHSQMSQSKGPKMTGRPLPLLKRDRTPDPGQYQEINVRSEIIKGRPFTGQRSSRFDKSERSKSPPPGSYDVKLPSTRGFKIDPILSRNGSQVSIHKHSRSTFNLPLNSLNPGPGSYDVSSSFRIVEESHIAFGARSPKIAKVRRDKKPDPGAYDIVEPKTAVNISLKGGRYKKRQPEVSPGPGQYNAAFSIVQPKTLQTLFNSPAKKRTITQTKSIGPGQYNVQFPKPNHITFGQKLQSSVVPADLKNPGPGTYDPSIKTTARNAKFGQLSQREKIEHQMKYAKQVNKLQFNQARPQKQVISTRKPKNQQMKSKTLLNLDQERNNHKMMK